MSDRMDLAKLAVDVGLMTNDWPSHQRLLAEVGVDYDHLLKVGRGVHQHRCAIGDSVLKVNSHRDALVATPSPLVGLRIAGAVDRPDSSGHLRSRADRRRARRDRRHRRCRSAVAYTPAGRSRRVPADRAGGVREDERWRVGTSWFVLDADPAAPEASGELDVIGFRYLTVLVRVVVREQARSVGLGYESAHEPVRLGDTACICFVRAPDGTWLEASQRASLTGALPVLS